MTTTSENRRTLPTSFIPLDALATTLGLPKQWVRAQAEAGAIPSLVVNGRRLYDVTTVREALVDQMAATPTVEAQQ